MATFVPKEVPAGSINGSNKVFTLLNAPSQVDDVFIDGAIYTDFTVSGSTITLTDAPTLSVFVDYWYGGTPSGTTYGTSTFGDIKAEVWALLGQKPTSTTFSDAIVGSRINNTLRELCRGRYVTPQGRVYRMGKIWFMSGKFPVRVKGGSILGADYNVGDTAITCDTTYLLPSGYVEIGGETISYTSVSSTQLLGVSGGTVGHLATESIIQLYQTPLAMAKPEAVYKMTASAYTSGTIQANKFEVPYTDGFSVPTISYQIVRDASRQLLKLNGLQDGDLLEVQYTKKLTDMGLDADLCALPEDYGVSVLAPLVAGELAVERNMPIGQSIMAIGTGKLQVMFGDLGNATTITRQSIKPIPYGKK